MLPLTPSLIFQVPESLMILFAVSTVLLIAVHMLALMISTCVLPNVEAVANLHFQVISPQPSKSKVHLTGLFARLL